MFEVVGVDGVVGIIGVLVVLVEVDEVVEVVVFEILFDIKVGVGEFFIGMVVFFDDVLDFFLVFFCSSFVRFGCVVGWVGWLVIFEWEREDGRIERMREDVGDFVGFFGEVLVLEFVDEFLGSFGVVFFCCGGRDGRGWGGYFG